MCWTRHPLRAVKRGSGAGLGVKSCWVTTVGLLYSCS